jgi:hypothetical protein
MNSASDFFALEVPPMALQTRPIRNAIALGTMALATWTSCACAVAGEPDDVTRVQRAINYLETRQQAWADFADASRGEGATKTTCVSCHTGIGYALARTALGRFTAKPGPSEREETILSHARRRTEHWSDLDSPQYRLMYDSDDRKKAEARGTEAVINALLLARRDAAAARAEPSAGTTQAIEILWATQTETGPDAGSWDWLNFGLEPWEADDSRAFGAALAAIAVGSVPRYFDQKLDEAGERGVRLLRAYLRRRMPSENLHNRSWILEASTVMKDILSAEEQGKIVHELLAAQHEDGGWSLADFGDFDRVDGSAQVRDPEGYATGLAIRTLLRSGVKADHPQIAKGTV